MNVPFVDLHSMNEEVRQEIEEAWSHIFATSAFIGGPYVEEFETAWAHYCDTSHAVGVANGTDAITLTLTALGLGPGDEVIVPANTFIATVSAVVAAGATPVFVDVDPATLLMTAAHVSAAVTPRTGAVIPVHLYGQPVDMPSILQVAGRAGIAVVEDAAQAHGARWNGHRVGTFGHAACFSFYPGKNLGALGDGGAVVTGDPALADRVRRLSNHGRGNDKHIHDLVGTNSRLDGLQAAFLSAKLRRLDAWNEARRTAAARYDDLLAAHVELTDQRTEAESVYHLYVIRTDDRDRLQRRLEGSGVAVGLHYPVPCHLQPPYLQDGRPHLPIAEDAAARQLSLPMFPHISEAQLIASAEVVQQHARERRHEAIA